MELITGTKWDAACAGVCSIEVYSRGSSGRKAISLKKGELLEPELGAGKYGTDCKRSVVSSRLDLRGCPEHV